MKELVFDSGLVTYSINGKCEVSFNPTDVTFAEKVFAAFDVLEKKYASWKDDSAKNGNKAEIFESARELDKDMRATINGLFDQDVCEPLFGNMNLYSFANGLPVWFNFMYAIMDEMDNSVAREQKLMNPRLDKYLKKYHR